MYTPSQVAEMLQIARSTVRKYARLYSEHLSESARRKQRKYTDSDIATLKRVVALRSEGVPLDEIPEKLGVVEIVEVRESLMLIPEIAEVFEAMRAMRVDQEEQAEVIAQLRADQETLQGEIEQLRQDLTESQRPFWEKIFTRKTTRKRLTPGSQ